MSIQKIQVLNNETLRLRAPSIFAESAQSDVSSRYSFLPTITVVEGMRSAGWFPVKAEEQTIRQAGRAGFQKHSIRFQRMADIETYEERNAGVLSFAPGNHQIRRDLSVTTPEIVLVNSHDRSSAYQIHAGLFRLICANGLVVPDSVLQKISVTHINFNPDSVIRASLGIAEQVPLIMNRVEEFKARRLSEVEARAFAEGAILLKYEDLESAPVSAARLLLERRAEDTGSDLWRTFNRVQENLTQGGQKEYGRRVENADGKRKRAPRTRAVKGIDQNLKLNKALWHLAEVLKAGGNPVPLAAATQP